LKTRAILAIVLLSALLAFPIPLVAEAFAAGEGAPVPFTPVSRGSHGGVTERRFVLVNALEEWKELWIEIKGCVAPVPPVPEVDFSRQVIAAVFQGLQRSGGYSISVEAIIETVDRVEVEVREKEPGPRSLVTMALTSPWEAVAFPRPTKPVLFTSAP
jgi:hypothetical protein